jgi:hypothetical protein
MVLYNPRTFVSKFVNLIVMTHEHPWRYVTLLCFFNNYLVSAQICIVDDELVSEWCTESYVEGSCCGLF